MSSLYSVTVRPQDTLSIYDGNTCQLVVVNPCDSSKEVHFPPNGAFFIYSIRIMSTFQPVVKASGRVYWNGKRMKMKNLQSV